MEVELSIKKGVCKVGFRNAPVHVRIFMAVILWTFILWLFTIGNPGFIPIAKFIIIVIVIPCAVVEWLKGKQVITKYLPASWFIAIAMGALIWHYIIR